MLRSLGTSNHGLDQILPRVGSIVPLPVLPLHRAHVERVPSLPFARQVEVALLCRNVRVVIHNVLFPYVVLCKFDVEGHFVAPESSWRFLRRASRTIEKLAVPHVADVKNSRVRNLDRACEPAA